MIRPRRVGPASPGSAGSKAGAATLEWTSALAAQLRGRDAQAASRAAPRVVAAGLLLGLLLLSLTTTRWATSVLDPHDPRRFTAHVTPGGVIVRTCLGADPRERTAPHVPHTAKSAALALMDMTRVVLGDPVQARVLGDTWDVWTQCGTTRQSRMFPAGVKDERTPHAIVFELFGACSFGAKRTLFEDMVNALGRPAAVKLLPETWFSSQATDVVEYARAHPNVRFILKRGHRQQQVDILKASDPELESKVRHATVTQVLMDTVMVGGSRTAFRTYTWLRCSGPKREPSALVDWMSPAYHATNNATMYASGYTGAKDIPNASELLRKHMSPRDAEGVRGCVVRTVANFLRVFGERMCQYPEGSEAPYEGAERVFSGALVAEVYGFDWIPVVEQDGSAGCRLLETNRFPDMSLTGSVKEPTPKDVLKICTHLRRFFEWTPEAAALRCDLARDETVVLPSDAGATREEEARANAFVEGIH